MKLLVVINSLGMGGAERSTAMQVPYLVERGIDLELVVFATYPHGYFDYVRQTGVPIHVLQRGSVLTKLCQLRALIRKSRPDVVHSILLMANLICRVATWGQNVMYVESLVNKSYARERVFKNRSLRLKHHVIKCVDSCTLFRVAHFHAVGESVRAHYQAEFNLHRSRITVIHRGRTSNQHPRNQQLRASLGVSASALLVLAVGRHEFQKGYLDLLDGVATVEGDFLLCIAGREGQATPAMRERHSALNLDGRVRFLGYRADVEELLASSDVYVSGSHFEGLPGGALEAMAAGVPLVVRAIPENREVADERCAFFFDRPSQLADHLQQLIQSPMLRVEMGARGRERFEGHFRIDVKSRHMADFYMSLINQQN